MLGHGHLLVLSGSPRRHSNLSTGQLSQVLPELGSALERMEWKADWRGSGCLGGGDSEAHSRAQGSISMGGVIQSTPQTAHGHGAPTVCPALCRV